MTRVRNARLRSNLAERLLRAPGVFLQTSSLRRQLPRQKGYILFQEFLPNNAFDTRITVIGDRAFGFIRANRRNDFAASGSGVVIHDPERIDRRCVDVAFRVASRLQTQSLAFDFLFDTENQPRIAEISYCFLASAVHGCPGHWDRGGRWNPGHCWPEDAILDDFLSALAVG